MGDGDDPVGIAGRVLGVVGGVEDGAALQGVGTQEFVQPGRVPYGETGAGLVEQKRVRIGQQSRGQAESAVHRARQGADALVGEAGESYGPEHFVGPGRGNAGRRAQHAQLAPHGARGVSGDVPQQHTDLTGGVRDAVERAAAEVRDATARLEFEHQPQGGALAGSGGAEKGGDLPRPGIEGEIVNGGRAVAAGAAGESDGLEHRFSRGR